MILAGIDEAGYGPVLGPLVVGACAFHVDCDEALPDLWKRLRKIVGRNRSKTGRKLHVNDSKLVYSPAIGLKELERGVLAIASCLHDWPEDLDQFLTCVAAHALAELAEHRWYGPPDREAFPIEQEAIAVRMIANALRAEMDRTSTRCVHYTARVVSERPLNRLFHATRNKSNALFSVASIHLDELVRKFGDQNLTIFCDRQGGRAHYGHLLRQLFDDWAMEIIDEAEGRSEYRIARRGDAVRIIFCEKGEQHALPVAAASMLCKYLREALMSRFNAFWKIHVPDVVPTAGYYNDGLRFLTDISIARTTLGIVDEDLVRSR